MDLTSYAELAVRLVNTSDAGGGHQDELATVEAYRALMVDRAALCARVSLADLDALRELRSQLRLIFAACAAADGDGAAARLNGLLARHPIHPEIARHDGGTWHLHHADSGSVADRYAAGAVLGLTIVITNLGTDRLRHCEAPSCPNVLVDMTPDRSRGYCGDRCAAKASVTALHERRRSLESEKASTAAVATSR
ncbi:MAG TPA: CGNR zinc finger domain-containing protein [Streptosporangiaceae bacterium]